MINPIFRQTVLISLLGHLAVFNLFSFSFGSRITKANYSSVSFLGDYLNPISLMQGYPLKQARYILREKPDTSKLKSVVQDYSQFDYYTKPAVASVLGIEKAVTADNVPLTQFSPKRKESTVMFYPALPYDFLLYFKDRQVVHIELMFNIISEPNKGNYIAVKRKISSGNLEADLLSMRYINRYLFIQQFNYPSDKWQSVKIELGPKKND